jgi:hypothetical protein
MALPMRWGLGLEGRAPDLPAGRMTTQLAFAFLERKRDRQRVWVQRKRAANPKPRPGGNTPKHRRGTEARVAKQMVECDRLLAEQQRKELPRWRRCEACGGREDTTAPHAHKEAA